MNKRLHDSGFGDMAGFFAAITADLGGSLAQLSVLVDAFFTDVSSDEDLADRYDLVNELYSVADNEQHVAAKFAELIVDRIYEYESNVVKYPSLPQAEVLSFLIHNNGTKQVDLGGIATQSVISEIVNGKRKMTAEHIKGFSEYFKVPVSLFYHF